MKTKPNESISPIVVENRTSEYAEMPPVIQECISAGLTKREYFAGLAMQGLLAADAKYNGKTNDRESLAVDAIAFADALIAELNTPA